MVPGWFAHRVLLGSLRAYQVWTIRPDGSGLTQVSSGPSNPGIPVWSPDGTHIAYGYYTWGVIDMRAPSPQQQEVEPAMSATERFMPIAWSPDGRRIAGPVAPVDGSVASLGIYTFATKAFSRVAADEGQATTWAAPAWLADSRRSSFAATTASESWTLTQARSGRSSPSVAR